MNLPNKRIFLIFTFASLCICYAAKSQQVQIEDDHFKGLQDIITNYRNYFLVGVEGIPLPMKKFTSLFDDPYTSIPCDFKKRNYLDDSSYVLSLYDQKFLEMLNDTCFENINVSDDAEVLYCVRSSCWYAWVKKEVIFFKESRYTSYTTVVRLKIIRKKDDSYKIKEIKLVGGVPQDRDRDQIADADEDKIECDECIEKLDMNKINFIGIYGCEYDDLDGDGIRNEKDLCPRLKGVASNHGCPDPPSSRIGFSLAGGALFPLFNEFNNQNIVDGTTWGRKGYFAKTGYIVDGAFRYNINRWSGLKIGGIFTNKKLDAAHLENQINFFLGNNHIITESVTVSSMAYQIFMPYVSLPFGNFNSPKSIISFEPLVGLAITDLGLFKNNFKVNIRYQNGGGNGESQNNSITFKTDPFLTYGAKINYERSIDPGGRCHLMASVYYIGGNYRFSSQSISFPGASSLLVFEGAKLQFMGVSAGLFFNLGIPENYGISRQ